MSRTTLMRTVSALLALVVVAVGASPAGAHPLGSATINHAVAIAIDTDGVTVDLVVDMAEIPAAQRISDIDTDGDLDLAQNELAAFAIDDCATRRGLLDVTIDGEFATGAIVAQTLDPEPGNAGLTTLRLACRFVYQHSAEPGAAHTIEVVNRADQGRSGWREMTATATDISFRATVPSISPTDLLRSYPDGDPTGPNLTSAEISYGALSDLADAPNNAARVDSGFAAGDGEVAASPAGGGGTDPLTGLLAQADSGMTALMVSLLVAAGIGAAHGLAPGHGKTVIAAYLVGTQGSRRQAVGLATAVAASHTVGVFVLGAVTLLASNRFAPDAIYPTLRLISAVVILGIGLTLLARAVVDRRSPDHSHAGLAGAHTSGAGHDHSHNHGDHDHSHDHDDPSHGHDHDHDHDHGGHDHDHGRDHGGHDHDHGRDHGGHEHLGHDHAHDSGFHVHGIIPHRHRTDWSSIDTSRALGWRTLAGLGLAGGIVPSTSAVLVLLGAVQIGRLDFGAGLVMAFGVGMSIALVSVGLGMVTLARVGGRRFNIGTLSDRWQRMLTPAAAALIIGVGVYLTVVAVRGVA